MENFIVSARKYRPATFDTVVGQSHITTTLKNALKGGQLAQAFLFCGPRGVGKTTCARILAKTINCLNPTDEYEACGNCESCLAFQRNGSLNIYELDAASNNSVDDIRNLVDQVRFPPQIGSRKVYIIDEVHMLSTAAFNAFLKTLEEPPQYVIFILATTEKHKIIPTILSRCQIFDFKRIEAKDMARHLQKIAEKEQIQAEYEALELIAQKADGGLRDALSLFDMISTFSGDRSIDYQTTIENLHILDYDYYFKMTEALLQEDLKAAFLILDDILRQGFDGHNFIVGLAQHFRDLMVSQDEDTIRLLEVSQKVRERYYSQSRQASLSFLLSAINLASQCDLNYKSSKSPRLLLEIYLAKMAHLNAVIDWDKHASSAESAPTTEKKKLNNPPSSQETPPAPEKASPSQSPSVQTNGQTQAKSSIAIPTQLDELEKAIQAEESKVDDSTQDQPFGKEELRAAMDFYKKVNPDHRFLRILNKIPEIQVGQVLQFHLTAKEKELFQEIKEDFLDKIRKRLKNQKIQVKIETVAEQEVRPYSNFQKYEYLAKKHPIIHQLKEKLGLDIDM